jgi:hypothetical protein
VAFKIAKPFQWRPLYLMKMLKCAVPLSATDKQRTQVKIKSKKFLKVGPD